MENYKPVQKIGEGAFGEVYKAKHKITGRVVALKRVRIPRIDDGLPLSLLREMQSLAHIEHTHVVPLFEHFAHGSSIVMSMELMYTDLHSMIKAMSLRNRTLPMPAIKCIMQMLLRGVHAVHAAHVMHRDLKPSNLLFSAHGVLKIGDFGLARVYDAHAKQPDYSHEVATRWYRAPELLYGSRSYDQAVDLWAVGCIFAELLTSAPLFPGQNDIDQLYRVVRTLGSPNASNWPEVTQLPDYDKITFPRLKAVPLREVLLDVDEHALDLLELFIQYRPRRRINALKALDHPFFHTGIRACHPSELHSFVAMAAAGAAASAAGISRHGGHDEWVEQKEEEDIVFIDVDRDSFESEEEEDEEAAEEEVVDDQDEDEDEDIMDAVHASESGSGSGSGSGFDAARQVLRRLMNA